MELLLEIGDNAPKPVYILSSDTQVEAPVVSEYVVDALKLIEASERARHLNLRTQLLFPDIDEGFWAKLIGKGYPPPSRWFRCCTSNLKIKPSRRAIDSIVATQGSVIFLLGSRSDEGANRAQSIQSFTNNERRLNLHHEIPNAMVFKANSFLASRRSLGVSCVASSSVEVVVTRKLFNFIGRRTGVNALLYLI